MIDWKQRLYAFLLRRVLGPLLDESSAQILHNSIDFSLQEGKFILKNINLDAAYLTKQLSDNCPGLRVRSGRINRLEINLTLRENYHENDNSSKSQSSLAWRAMKLGSWNESLPAVSLIAEIKVDDIFIELETIDFKLRKPCPKESSNSQTQTAGKGTSEEEAIPKNIIGSYIEAALTTLQLNLKLTNIHVKLCQQTGSNCRNVSVGIKVSSFSYNDLDVNTTDNAKASMQTVVVNKVIEFSEIIVETNEDSTSTHSQSVVAFAEGNGQIFLRVIACKPSQTSNNQDNNHLLRDVDVRLNHQLNFSLDNHSLLLVQQVIFGFSNITETNTDSDEVSIFRKSSMMKNPHIESTDLDREDLKALTGIMRQYREAYHMAEQNKLKGGILVPSNAYLDEGLCAEEVTEDESTFDMFFDANDQSLYHTTAILMASTRLSGDDGKNDDHLDQIHTKLRINLLSSCFKINFGQCDPKKQTSHSQEYILATLNDLSLSLQSTNRTNEIDLRITHIQVEDAYLAESKTDTESNFALNSGAVKIGSILEWFQGDGFEEENALVSEAPCVNIQWRKTSNNTKEHHVDCSVTFLPLEMSFRQRTMNNISNFASVANDRFSEFSRLAPSPQPCTYSEGAKNDTEISLSFDCPSISLYLPLMEETRTEPIFKRCGQILTSGISREPSIGVVFENTGCEFKLHQGKDITQDQPNVSAKFWCLHMGLVVIAPNGKAGYETHMLRKDIFVASGRTEVNPSTPISFSFKRGFSISREENPGRESFPIVPAISSFKARQEDDDENSSSSRNDLRGTDPQITMLANSEKSTTIFKTDIPEIIIDLTATELETFLLVLRRIQKPFPHKEEKVRARSPSQADFSEKLSFALNLDKVTVSIRDDKETNVPNEGKPGNKIYSFLLAMDKIKSHIFVLGPEVKHFRLFTQDLCLYSSYGMPSKIQTDSWTTCMKGRFAVLKNTIRAFSEVSVVPIFFRSQLFTPISQETPSILFDFIDLSASNIAKAKKLLQRRVYFTVYHLTFRYNADSDWIERFSDVVHSLQEEAQENSNTNLHSKKKIQENDERSMTRLFVSFADVNIDYKAPRYFETHSKSIIRVGDFRLSSNMMKPAGLKQSYKLSVGDVTYHITSDMNENQYRNENSSLCRSSLIVKRETCAEGPKTSLFGTMPEAILRELNFVNIVSLDALDLVLTQRNEEVASGFDRSKDPSVSISVTAGTLSVHGCKDSFTCFSKSVGELQSKLVGLTDNDIEILKEKSLGSMLKSKSTGIQEQVFDDFEHENQYLIQAVKTPKEEDSSHPILLDGHEWTTIENDLSPGLVIPPGDEQISGWYNTDQNRPGESLPPSQMKHQHFPFHATVDLLSQGDMGARTLVGETEDLVLKSGLSVRKLNVKIRLFDGYDWPDKCSVSQKKAVERLDKNFVIEPLPQSDLERNKTEDAEENMPPFKTRAKLMEELLDLEDNPFEAVFEEVPLPEDKASRINHEKYLRLSRRRPNAFCQVSLNGISLRMDSYQQSKSNRLQSILEVSVSNLFVAETVSDSKPIKMIGEWSNDYEHPRDTRFGTLMLNMATWAPENKITEDNEIASEECNVSIQLMPMRCLLDQRAISFMKAFFNNEDSVEPKNGTHRWCSELYLPPPPTFKSFKIKPWKLKVDYYPTRIDVTALREGSVVELVNLSPIQRMVITLDEVVVLNSDGPGPVFSEIVSRWIKEICATQLHKFLANARPFEPFTDVGQGLTDLIILPYEAFKQGDSIQRAMKNGVKSLAETVVFQTLATTSGLTKMAAGLMADSLGLKGRNDASDPLPSRPLSIPKGIGDARLHAARSLARGVSAANYKVVVVPYREYLRNGVSGAVTSVIKGIPVLLVAPLSGATEAASYTLLGAQNALRPDLRKEEEASIL